MRWRREICTVDAHGLHQLTLVLFTSTTRLLCVPENRDCCHSEELSQRDLRKRALRIRKSARFEDVWALLLRN